MLVHSILLNGPSGVGKSTFLRRALEAEGSGLVCASPLDELDSYYGLKEPNYRFAAFDDGDYLPSLVMSQPTGLKSAITWLRDRLIEIKSDVDSGKPSRYAVLGLDTVSMFGTLALNATMAKYNLLEPPAAMSPNGAAFYTYLRNRQEEFLRLARTFRGYGVHLIALSHVTETEVKETAIVRDLEGSTRMNMPSVPGGFKNILPSFFSTVLYGGLATVLKDGKKTRVHYVQHMGDPKRPTKNRFGALDTNDRIENDWLIVKAKIEAAANRLIKPGETA